MVVEEVKIYSTGPVFCSACVLKGLGTSYIEQLVNQLSPTGIDSKWKISTENFKDGTPNPTECKQDKNRVHYLLNC